MTYTDIIRKLIGPINPIGETNQDTERLDNLKVLIELTENLLSDIRYVAEYYDERTEYSIKKANATAKVFIKALKTDL